MIGYIYKISIDNLNYIGSCRDINNRKKSHLKRSKEQNHNNLKLYSSNFNLNNFEILEQKDCIDDNDLFLLEQKFIEDYNSINNGLNHKRAYLSKENDQIERRISQKKYKNKNKDKCNESVRNINKKNRESGKFSCDICNFNFASNRDLQRHLKSKRHLNKLK
tara:strand:- start:37 stop:525 length:489 start_codon:yes stop_codon:yes gene_type:complete